MKFAKSTPAEQSARRIPIFTPNHQDNSDVRAKPLYRKVALPTMEGIHFEKVEEIVFLEAKGNYSNIHFINGKKLLVCKTLREMEELLNARNQFVRVHRSFTINLNLLKKYIKGKGGYVVMENQNSISVSAGKKQDFLNALEIYFGG